MIDLSIWGELCLDVRCLNVFFSVLAPSQARVGIMSLTFELADVLIFSCMAGYISSFSG